MHRSRRSLITVDVKQPEVETTAPTLIAYTRRSKGLSIVPDKFGYTILLSSGGTTPKELRGMFTEYEYARQAIHNYIVKNNGYYKDSEGNVTHPRR